MGRSAFFWVFAHCSSSFFFLPSLLYLSIYLSIEFDVPAHYCTIHGSNESGVVTIHTAWQHMAAMVLAVDHFNERNASIISNLQNLDCGGTDLRLVNISVVDTGTSSHTATQTILNQLQQHNHTPIDAIVGPYNAQPTLELSVLATGLEAPLVALRGSDHNLILPDKHPFYTQINPDLTGEMEFVGQYLRYRGRTNYIAILHSSDDSVLQRVQVLQQELLRDTVPEMDRIQAYGYQSVDKAYDKNDRGIRQAVENIARTGYRTIIFITGTPDLDTPELGQAAHDYELDQGSHFWILVGQLDASSTDKNKILETVQDSPVGGFLRGASYLYLLDVYKLYDDDPFTPIFRSQNASFVQRLRDLNPVPNYFVKDFHELNVTWKEGEPFPPDDIFQQLVDISDFVSFAYDAVMAIGIGACHAMAHQNGTTTTGMTGQQHLAGIRSVDFRGLSGEVKFGNTEKSPGSRVGSSVYHSILNLLPHGADR